MSNKKKKSYDIKQTTISDYVCYLYFIVILGVYPIITHNQYFDITRTRYRFFTIVSAAFVGLSIMAYLLQDIISEYNGMPSIIYKEKINYKHPIVWMGLFTFANIYAMFSAPNMQDAFTGQNGRFMGAWMYIVIGLTFLFLFNRVKTTMLPIIIFSLSVTYAYIIAIFQHMGNDFMKYKENIAKKQYHIFVSTLGNINIFASFMVITLAVFMSLYIFTKNNKYRLLSAVMLVLGGMNLMIANSDSAFIGLAAISIVLVFISYAENLFTRFVEVVFCVALGTFCLVLLNKLVIKKYDKRGGVAEALDRIWLVTLILVAIVIFYMLIVIAKKIFKDKLEAINKKKMMIILAVGLVLLFIAGIIVCVITDRAITKFNYKWGTYRGYIWAKCIDLFNNGTIGQKLFGYGNETTEMLTKSHYYKEMIAVTKKVYDNAHNEVLQYLVTTGLLGAISYIGLFVSSVMYILKNMKDNVIAHISLAVVVGYFAQGLINLNQPITTPFYFVFMAIGIGSIRYDKWVKEND